MSNERLPLDIDDDDDEPHSNDANDAQKIGSKELEDHLSRVTSLPLNYDENSESGKWLRLGSGSITPKTIENFFFKEREREKERDKDKDKEKEKEKDKETVPSSESGRDIRKLQHKHNFRQKNFKVPSICSVCNKFIYGFGFQGYVCSEADCNYKGHKDCIGKLAPEIATIEVESSRISPRDYEKQIAELKRQLELQQAQQMDPLQTSFLTGSYAIHLKDIVFGRFLGSGACGEVYHGMLHGAEVAVKVLALNEEQREQVAATFQHEVEILMKLHHPNIVLFMGASTDSNQFIIVTEFTEHGSLYDVLHQNKQPHLSWRLRIQIAEHTALGMNWLHNQRPPILHRDLKTANILIDRNLNAKLCDFGISNVFEDLNVETGFLEALSTQRQSVFYNRPMMTRWIATHIHIYYGSS
eukprot:TRINITY_DN1146_c0_g1_i3.p1 TRINITY_DN1146_c0_g1~~TRINITY_DN1146_c0_g1_i3.p1  ORF type:complete len:413 (-),score=54.73 TRINITY_DN1146_c0_g1_i3:78-1316(-)